MTTPNPTNMEDTAWEERVRTDIEDLLDADSHSMRIPSAVMFKDIQYIAERMIPLFRKELLLSKEAGVREGREEVTNLVKSDGLLTRAHELIYKKRHREVTFEDDAVVKCFRQVLLEALTPHKGEETISYVGKPCKLHGMGCMYGDYAHVPLQTFKGEE